MGQIREEGEDTWLKSMFGKTLGEEGFVAYWYKEKIAGCNQGYYLFDGDDSFLIVVHGSGNDWPSNIQNVRIVKE